MLAFLILPRLLALGQYPDVSLANARERRDEARRQLANGIDPGAVKRARKELKREAAENSFEVIGREWFAKISPNWAPGHAKRVKAKLENDLYPWISAGRRRQDAVIPARRALLAAARPLQPL